MKKCSHADHHALAELNITPLLDLAFVLLVIFIITTTPVVNDLEVDLPAAAERPKEQKPKVHYVTVQPAGQIFLDQDPVELALLEEKVIGLRMKNAQDKVDESEINVVIRGSGRAKYSRVVEVMDTLQRSGLVKVNLATEALPDGSKAKE